jgi:hypothetical protein
MISSDPWEVVDPAGEQLTLVIGRQSLLIHIRSWGFAVDPLGMREPCWRGSTLLACS